MRHLWNLVLLSVFLALSSCALKNGLKSFRGESAVSATTETSASTAGSLRIEQCLPQILCTEKGEGGKCLHFSTGSVCGNECKSTTTCLSTGTDGLCLVEETRVSCKDEAAPISNGQCLPETKCATVDASGACSKYETKSICGVDCSSSLRCEHRDKAGRCDREESRVTCKNQKEQAGTSLALLDGFTGQQCLNSSICSRRSNYYGDSSCQEFQTGVTCGSSCKAETTCGATSFSGDCLFQETRVTCQPAVAQGYQQCLTDSVCGSVDSYGRCRYFNVGTTCGKDCLSQTKCGHEDFYGKCDFMETKVSCESGVSQVPQQCLPYRKCARTDYYGQCSYFEEGQICGANCSSTTRCGARDYYGSCLYQETVTTCESGSSENIPDLSARKPTLAALSDRSAVIGEIVTVYTSSVSNDGESVRLSLDSPPPGAKITNGIIEIRTGGLTPGVYTIVVRAASGIDSSVFVTQSFKLNLSRPIAIEYTDPTSAVYTPTSGQFQPSCNGNYQTVVAHRLTLTQPAALDLTFSGAVHVRHGFARVAVGLQPIDANGNPVGSIIYGTEPTVSPAVRTGPQGPLPFDTEFPFISVNLASVNAGRYLVVGAVNCPAGSDVFVWLGGLKSSKVKTASVPAPTLSKTSGQFVPSCNGGYEKVVSEDITLAQATAIDSVFSGAVHLRKGFARLSIVTESLDSNGDPTGQVSIGTQPTVSPGADGIDVEFPFASIDSKVLQPGRYRISGAVSCPAQSDVFVWLGALKTVKAQAAEASLYSTTNGQFVPTCDKQREEVISQVVTMPGSGTLEVTFSGAAHLRKGFVRMTAVVQRLDILGHAVGDPIIGTSPTVSNGLPPPFDEEYPFGSIAVAATTAGIYRVSGVVDCPKDSNAFIWLSGLATKKSLD